ncbi:hypothetical protein SAMN04487897_10753 [Paenibacillus sp. yr247]|nr:hypothetical protein SAMN04487897_10753 [Paenibacillus sp. yr247]
MNPVALKRRMRMIITSFYSAKKGKKRIDPQTTAFQSFFYVYPMHAFLMINEFG